MISTAIIPKIMAVLANAAFDVYSGRHVRRIVDLAEEVEASVEDGNAKLHVRALKIPVHRLIRWASQILLKTITTAFETAITNTESLLVMHKAIHRGPSSFDPEAIPARRRFLARQVKLLTNLLRWRKHTRERYGVDSLVKSLVGRCILDIAEGGWEVGGEEIAGKVRPMPLNIVIY
jgi:GC-rich sequence DNA-binding factor